MQHCCFGDCINGDQMAEKRKKPNFIELSMRYRIVSFTIAAMLVAVGIYSLLTMPRSENPEFTVRQALITAYYPGANEIDVDNQVTKPLEQYLFTFKEVRKEKTYSTTKEGVVYINIELNEWVKDADRTWATLQNNIDNFKRQNLPQNIQGPVINSNFGETVALLISLSSPLRNYRELNKFMDKVEDKLKENTTASRLIRVGNLQQQINIRIDDQKLSRYNVDYTTILNTLMSQSQTTGGGQVKLPQSDITVFGNNRFTKIQDIENQIIYTDSLDNNVRLRDVATFARGYQDTTQMVEMNHLPILILSVEMKKGNNMTKFGKDLQEQLDEVKKGLPPDVNVVTFVNQPNVVKESINHFLQEFGIAIIAVIIVVLLLLPFKVALISAISCPLSIMIAFGISNVAGLTLHQVSLAGMIVVLGMVVDDSIVVVDNYVEKLDEGMKPWQAAWKSATEIFIPVLTATISIIFAFAPLALFLPGQQKEFAQSLPIIVGIALATSFTIAMLIVPALSFLTIKKGLHADEKKDGKEDGDQNKHGNKGKSKKDKKSILDRVQGVYNKALEKAFNHSTLIIVLGICAFIAGGFLMSKVPQQFSSKAERDQLNVEIWLPRGTPFSETHKVVRQVESEIKKDSNIVNLVSFIGTSSPRFYASYAPENPRENYAQIFINTKSVDAAEELAKKYVTQFHSYLPEGFVRVHQLSFLQEKFPLEIRILGDNIHDLKTVSDTVQSIVRGAKGTNWVHDDFENDYMALGMNIKQDEAQRLGITATQINQTLAAGLNGQSVGVLYEGKEPINVVMRFDDDYRHDFNKLATVHIDNTQRQKIPLRDVVDFAPEWHTGNIMHRTGIRTLTVSSEAQNGIVAADMLKEIKPKLDELKLPAGVHIEYGGDQESTEENTPGLAAALLTSIILIFLTMLVQFRSLKKTFIILCTFPLSLLGASVGLLATGNYFGFTAFMGIISLIGIVVRNGIILVDYADELRETQSLSVRDASLHAGERRMRPILLTTLAAAAGVTPMIVSGSPIWAPLGSSVGFGVLFSMFFTLFIIPVLYIKLIKPDKPKPEEQDDEEPDDQQNDEQAGDKKKEEEKQAQPAD